VAVALTIEMWRVRMGRVESLLATAQTAAIAALTAGWFVLVWDYVSYSWCV